MKEFLLGYSLLNIHRSFSRRRVLPWIQWGDLFLKLTTWGLIFIGTPGPVLQKNVCDPTPGGGH